MEGQKKKRENILYMVIGVMTLMVATIGATFAYFTATASNNNVIKGNMATISFDVSVTKKTTVDESKGGLIPMTNSMVEKAVTNASNNGICVDDNGNAVCQIYKITVTNSGTASMFVDGYVTLTGGSGNSTDYPTATTTMRWSQAFCNETSNNLTSCTTAGTATARQNESAGFTWTALGSVSDSQADAAEIKDAFSNVTGTGTIQANSYSIINTNYIRVSKHSGTGYQQQADVTSALVYNQYLSPNDGSSANNTGDSSATYVDAQVYYIIVWLSETGTNQTAGSGGTNVPATTNNFFQGTVTFNSAQGSEVTATFAGYTTVTPDTQS